MSLDLWNEFVDGTGDPSENPWAQPTSHGKSEVTNQTETIPLGATPTSQATRGWDNSNDRQTEWRSSLTDAAPPAKYIEMNSGFGTENVWTTSHSHSEELPPWSVSEYSSSITRTSKDPLPRHGTAQDDDFGDFETPDVAPPFVEKVQRHFPLITPSEVLFDEEMISHGSAVSRQYNKTMSHQEYKPYSEIKKLEKPFPNHILGSESQDADISSWGPSSVKKTNTPLRGLSPVQNRASLSIDENVDIPYAVEEWGEFSPEPPTGSGLNEDMIFPVRPYKDQSSVSTSHSSPQFLPPAEDKGSSKKSSVSKDRILSSTSPSSLPPPSILISHMSTLIQKLPSQVEAVVLQSFKSQISQEALDKALRRCIASLKVSARIVAGRKVRWKRDSHLSQSMKIGPAQAGKKGGMKLTGVDKAETQREDREVAEFVRIWKQRLGSIKSALAMVNGQISGSPLVLPEISERMVILVAKAPDGSASSSKSCALCGLKREERIAKVDVDIWDGFEEWWSDFWGHTECRIFWEEHKRFLQQV